LKGKIMAATCRYKFLVIDNQDLLEINHLQRRTNQAVKHPEPVLKQDDPWCDKMEMFNYNNVLYDTDEKLFRMWYVVCGQTPDEYWERGRKTAYATSGDGIHWEKPIMNMVEINGSKENNYIIGEMLSLTYTIIDDPSDIPQRRYKMIFQVDSEESQWAKYHMPLNLAYSADGIHWDRPTHVNPILRGVSDAGWGFLYDHDRRKYQLYTRRVPNVPRDISLYESYDLVNWEDKGRILVPGDDHDPPEMFNFQSVIPFIYEDFCLGLLNTQYSLPGAESYEIFNDPPVDWPSQTLGHVDLQLAYSRDGVNWSRPADRSPIVPNGEPGSPDEGVIFVGSANPFVIDGDTYLYYTAVRYQHNDRTQRAYMKAHNFDMRDAVSCMLAKMPEDHWVSLDADSKEGSFVCKPWGPPHEIFVNADAAEGAIEAELVTPYGKAVPEYSRGDSIAVTANGKNQQIKWKHGKSPWETIAKDHLGGLLVKFYLKRAKLYSYTFTLPDPDGQLERDRLNARWCDHIKHRSGNWDRNSNEPADGVPPYIGPGPETI
jgi:hypothetical protein